MNLYSIPKSKEFKEKSEGHPEIWKCSFLLQKYKKYDIIYYKVKKERIKLKRGVVYGTSC
jgi:hypothetical protein